MRRCALALVAILIAGFALAGCGSADDQAAGESDDSSSTSDSTNAPDSDDNSTSDDSTDNGSGGDTDDKGADKSDDDGTDDNEPADDAGDKKTDDRPDADDQGESDDKPETDDGAAGSEYCENVRGLRDDFDPSNLASADSSDLGQIVDRLDDIAESAPAGIAPSWNTLTAAFDKVSTTLDKYDVDLSDPEAFAKLKPKAQREIQKAASGMQDLAATTRRIETSVQSDCGVSLQQ